MNSRYWPLVTLYRSMANAGNAHRVSVVFVVPAEVRVIARESQRDASLPGFRSFQAAAGRAPAPSACGCRIFFSSGNWCSMYASVSACISRCSIAVFSSISGTPSSSSASSPRAHARRSAGLAPAPASRKADRTAARHPPDRCQTRRAGPNSHRTAASCLAAAGSNRRLPDGRCRRRCDAAPGWDGHTENPA